MDNPDKDHTSFTERVSSEKQTTRIDIADTDHHAVLTNILKTQPVKTWGSGSLHLYAVCLLVYLCSTMNGLSGLVIILGTITMRLLTFDRLRRLAHGIYQRRTKLHCILQSSARGKQRHRTRLRHLPDRSDGGSIVQLGCGLAWASVADFCGMPWDMHRCHCDCSRSDHSCVHWGSLHVVVLLDNCDCCCSDVPH